MENMLYAEELLREFLVFRGFTGTLQGFQVDKLLELVFSAYVPKFQADKLVSLLSFFRHRLSSSSDAVLAASLGKLEVSILRYYIVYALQSGRPDKVIAFFGAHGNNLLHRREDWTPWFAIPYIKNPSLDPQFRVYFSREWLDALRLSFRNFLSEIFNGFTDPCAVKISTEKNTVKYLKNDIKQLNTKLSQLQALLEAKEAELSQIRSSFSSPKLLLPGTKPFLFIKFLAFYLCFPSNFFRYIYLLSSPCLALFYLFFSREEGNLVKEEEFPEVKVDFQETFLGHTSPITRCRFSAAGTNIASASVDGTVRIWTYNSSTPTSRNATIYCGAEIMSLDWECRSDRLCAGFNVGFSIHCFLSFFFPTAAHRYSGWGIKAWNVDAKRVVCDLSTTSDYPSVMDLKCSPVEPILSLQLHLEGNYSYMYGLGQVDEMGFASLIVWNMKTWKPTSVLPLGKDPPAITSLSSAADGMIHMFDMSANLQITGWPAHDSAICSVLFGPDETSIFSLGSDGKMFEWSLQNQGQVLWSRDCSRFCHLGSSTMSRHEIGLDSDGRDCWSHPIRLDPDIPGGHSPTDISSCSSFLILALLQGHRSGLRTLPHTSAITTVDWHPTLPIFLTGSADHSVRVTSII
ncbi:unnamed protein product [Spirodela intermedia]|uniref:ARMC9 CTLH-like domain-containing protein n=1 Tax=Spirodela intermedia TaxID=51605 RepID=A0A7I8J907_SPIIN|nr:unnamed protein product [Spirodela intermedia]CAA6665932.1 unnamed protein product [Spirodela intermedia]